MPGLNLSPVNFGALAPNPLAQIGQALGAFPNTLANSQVTKQQQGEQLLAPFKAMAQANPRIAQDPKFIARVTMISREYGLPVPMLGGSGETFDAGHSESGTAPATPAIGTAPTPSAAPAAGAPATAPSMSFGAPGVPGITPGAQPTPSEAMMQKLISDKGQPPGMTQPNAQVGGAPPTQPQQQSPTGAESMYASGGPTRIDVNAWTGKQLSFSDVKDLMAMDPTQRAAALSASGYSPSDFNQSFLNAPQQITPAEKAQATERFSSAIMAVPEGKNTPDALKVIAEAYRPILGDAVVDGVLNSADNIGKIGQALQMQFDKLKQAGFWKQKDYDVAMGKLHAAIARNATYQELADIQKTLLPHRTALMDDQATRALAEANAAHTRSSASAASSGLTKGQIAQQYASALRSYNSLQAQVGRASNYKDPLTGKPEPTQPPDDILDAASNAGDDVDYWTEQMREAGMPVKARSGANLGPAPSAGAAAGNAASSGLAKQGVQTTDRTYMGTDKRNGKKVYQNHQGKYVYDDGTAVPQQ